MRAYRTILWTIIIVIVSVFIAISLQSPFSIADEGAGPVISEGGDDSVAPSEGSLEGNEEEAVVSSEDAAENPADEATQEKDKKGAKEESADKAEAERGVQAAGTTGGDEGGPGAGVVSVPVLQNLVFTGAATAEIPIIVPPGRGGTAPKLAFRYNSYRGNGWLGVGWDLDLGAIQRSAKWGLDYGATDFVAIINGSSSELVPRPDWGAGLYSAKIEGEFAKYYLNPSTNGWEVAAKDGTRYYYGTTAASRQDSTLGVFGWHLDRVEDPNGNSMTVSYTKDQGQIYPDRIDYTGNASGLNPTNYVQFYLEARTDVYPIYTTNAEVRTAYRLKTIEVVATGVRARVYKITYTDSAGTSRSLLASVQQYGADAALDASGNITAGTALPALTCAYAPEFNGTYTAGPYSKPMDSGTYGAAGWQRAVGDVDGDGKTDIIFSWASTSGGILVRAMLSNGDGTYTAGPYSKPMDSGAYGAAGWQRMVGDVNGDGKADLIFSYAIDTSYGMQVRALLSNGDGTYTAGPYSRPMSTGTYGAAGWQRMVGDVNGDGKADIIFSYAISTSYGMQVRALLSNGDGTYTAGPYSRPMSTGTYGAAGWYRMVGDVDGDGKTDIIFSWASTSGGILVRALLSNGDGTYTAGAYSKPMDSGAYGAEGWCRMVGDVNGDGKADLIFSLAIETSYGILVRALLSNGDGTYTAGAYSKPMDSGAYGATGWYRMVGDVNGDGKTDIIFSWAVSTSNGIEVRSVLSSITDNNLLTSLSNGLGGTVAIEYTPSSSYQNTLLPFILQPVSAIIVDDGLGNQSVTTYSYEGGLYSFETRDFRGFARVVQTNPDKTIEETRFLQDAYRQGRQYQVDLSAPAGGALLAQTTLAWDTYPETPPEGAWAFVKLAQRRTEYYDAETVYSQEAYTYDDTTGNLLSKTTSGTDAEAVTTAYQYQNYSAWLWRQTKETITGAITGKVRETTYEYDTKGNRTSESRWLNTGASPLTTMTYDSYGNKITETDPRGNTTAYTYETVAYTYPARITRPSTGGVSHIIENEAYDYRFGKVTRTRDENGNLTSYAYDLFGRLQQTDHPNGGQQVNEYYDNVFPRYTITKAKEQAGQTIDAYTFSDGLAREIQKVTFGEGGKAIVTKKHYDEMGRIMLTEGPFFGAGVSYPQQPPAAFSWERTSYDYRGRPVLIERPDGEHTLVTTSLSYQGFMTTTTDPDNSQRTEVKDYLGRIIQVTEHVEAGQQHTLYDYDAAGDLVRVIDALGNQTLMTYDTLGRKIGMEDPDMGSWEYAYDANGNLLTQRDAKNQVITVAYDELNRVVSKTYSTSDLAVTYTYDSPSVSHGIGRLASVSSTNATTAYIAYDPMGRVKGITKTIAGDGARATGYDYDLAGKTIRTTYPDGYQVTYAYYPGSGLLATVTGSDAEVYAACTLYEPTGKMGQVTHGNGTATRYTYDPSSTRLYGIVTTDPSGQPAHDIQRRSYSYTRAGDIAGIVDDLHGITYTYTYDKLHRLLAETNTGSYAPISYTYNAIGNILAKTMGAGTYAYTYDTAHKHAVKTITYNSADHTYTYDLNGNMINGPDFTDPGNIAARTITYNADNMPLRIVHPQATVDLVYDGNGTRTKKVVQGGATTYYIGEDFEVIGGIATKYIFAGNLRVAKLTGSTRYYFHKDHLGSSTAMTDASGVKVEITEYVPYGEMRAHTGAEVSNYKFTDQELDPESGLYNYDARLYDPAIGRFVSPDTIVLNWYDPQSLNRYSYCRNNPLIYVDPSGHWFWDWLFGNGGTSSYYDDYSQRAFNYVDHNTAGFENNSIISRAWNGISSTISNYVNPQFPSNSNMLSEEEKSAALREYSRKVSAPYIDLGATIISLGASSKYIINGFKSLFGEEVAKGITNPIPSQLARVIPGEGPFTTLGRPGASDVFVTAAEDIAGMNPAQIAERLAIPPSKTFTIIEFPTPLSGLASPVFRNNPGFVGYGLTGGGAREFVIPNGPIPFNAIIKVVKP